MRRVLVPHMEEGGEGQENEKDDEREDGKQRVEGRVVENQNNHIISARGWDEMKCATHTPNLSQCQCDNKMCAVTHEKI